MHKDKIPGNNERLCVGWISKISLKDVVRRTKPGSTRAHTLSGSCCSGAHCDAACERHHHLCSCVFQQDRAVLTRR